MLSILIRSGTHDNSALVVAQEVLQLVKGNLSLLAKLQIKDLLSIKGIGKSPSRFDILKLKNINNYQSPTIAMHIDKVSAINGGDGEPFTITLAVSQIKPYGNSSTVSFSIDDIISVDIYPSFGPTPIGMPYKVSSVHADGLNAETRGKICFGFKDY